MLRDRFENKRKKTPPAPSGGILPSRRPAPQAPQVPTDKLPPAEKSTSAPHEAQIWSAAEGTTLSGQAANYADELKRRWEASFHKSRSGKSQPGDPSAAWSGQFEPGQTINGIYQIEAPLTKGGMGCVYRCLHIPRNKTVVLKVLLQDRKPEDQAFIKFVQECKIAITIEHPNIVQVFDWGILGDTLAPYLVMEYLAGHSLRDALSSIKKVPLHDAAGVLTQACNGLEYVHREDIIHRDLKPENLMVMWEDDGTAEGKTTIKILDFGIAQLHEGIDFTDGGRAAGTLSYMSPEQIQTKPLDLRSDIYAMGVVFYELITGRVPFKGKNAWETMSMHVFNPHIPASALVRLEYPQLVDQIIARCLAKKREERYSSVVELAGDLSTLLTAGSS